jgi:hypothetical protein
MAFSGLGNGAGEKRAETRRERAEASWVRLTYFKLQPDRVDEMKRI